MKRIDTDILIVGTGAAGLFAALHADPDKKVLMITKVAKDKSDSYLAQGGICVLKDESDYDSFFEDTMKAGHYENRRESVDIMIRSSKETINELIGYGVEFTKKGDHFDYTREGCHSKPRILYHEDITGKEITSKLLAEVLTRKNITILENMPMVDILERENVCYGVLAKKDGEYYTIRANYTIWATGGIGGLFCNSTNYPHLRADAVAIAIRHGVQLEHPEYIQFHPTTLYSKKHGRSFLISESIRGEGAKLYGADGKRFANEILPRDLLTKEILKQMKKDHKPFVWLDMTVLGKETIVTHFPHIYQHCLNEGYDCTKEWIPVVPGQHYYMGGVYVDKNSKTSMERLYAAGETSCNGVHGKNRLASNSLLESLVFAKRAMQDIKTQKAVQSSCDLDDLAKETIGKLPKDYVETYKNIVLNEIKKRKENQ